MNTSALRSFAPAVRRELIEAVGRKLDVVLAAESPDYRTTFAPQVADLRELALEDRLGLVEKVAYTWFNRLTALRYLDARGWHPFRARVLTSVDEGSAQPELLRLARDGALPEELKRHIDAVRLDGLLDGKLRSSNPQCEVYRDLVLASCRFYHSLLPDVFERLDDATELLLPDDLLTEHSVVQGFRTKITDEDCADVEVLGWLYQFYISERKDEVMARKSAVPTEDVPAVTQLFTPHWIVRYLVENSLGRLWLLNRPGSRLREHMPYCLEGEKNAPGGSPDDFLKIAKPEEIRVCDPAVGSGHMLTYAFDLLHLIYEEEGYAPTEIPALILRHNLHGLEICPRAAQLAELALVFKAREKSRRFFQPEHLVRPRIIELCDVRFAENELRDYIRALGLGDLFSPPILRLLHQFEEAKNFGSLIQPCLDERSIADLRCAIEATKLGGQLFLSETHLKVRRVLEQAEALTKRYHVVVANPPYMGSRQMNASTKDLAELAFPNAKADLYSMFIERAGGLAMTKGACGLVTMQSWMFLSTFEQFRNELLASKRLLSMAHLGPRGFDAIAGEVVQTTVFIYENSTAPNCRATFFRLIDGQSEDEKEASLRYAILNSDCPWRFSASAVDFRKIPGSPIAYWLGPKLIDAFVAGRALSSCSEPKSGLSTTDNAQFLRFWHEVSFATIGFGVTSIAETEESHCRWYPFNKGGDFRKWWGNNEYVVNWHRNGAAIKEKTKGAAGGRVVSPEYYFQTGVTWSGIASSKPSMRILERSIFGSGGKALFAARRLSSYLGFLNSKVALKLLEALSPTLNFEAGQIGSLPILVDKDDAPSDNGVTEMISIARWDWDNTETSWDFRDAPLLRPGLKYGTLETSWRNWAAESTVAIRRMQELETENNRHFIAAYGVEDELQPEVPEEQITLARAEARRDMAAFLSYAVGCTMGRYSPDHPGLILANAGDSVREFLEKVGKPLTELTFEPDEDGIIPVLDGEWFEDDIVARTRDFLRATFGDATLRENLHFIEDSLGKDLRKYFLTDFYKDHLQTYKKRPIYWMVQSPKKGFSALVYLHRYTRDTLNLVLNRYLREYVVRLRSRQAHLAQSLAGESLTAAERTASRKESERIVKALHECEEWERESLLPLAQQRLELDLDAGVKVNYLRLADVLAPIPGLATKDDE